eukprot:CAMPEP_0113538528 /NCGR_PEP_ID=MMETSP0015_2-20120614/7413_1 /TAXON_ID=2838 /ORGANISM="Odontella" /LENGTH=520 /DNA_ID=CAMNT_0000438107 /DNA_START=309 /DNA_END=1871 /DNA_ORIENTATION=- /assembly_acc=CAM_ASM_000160
MSSSRSFFAAALAAAVTTLSPSYVGSFAPSVPISSARRNGLSSPAAGWRRESPSSTSSSYLSASASAVPFYAKVSGDEAAASDTPTVATPPSTSTSSSDDNNSSKMVIVAGATGYIGRAVVRESVRLGYDTVALVRDAPYVTDTDEGRRKYGEPFAGARVVQADVEDGIGLANLVSELKEGGRGGGDDECSTVDAIVSCLASPLGTKREAVAIDYQATLNCLDAGRDPRVSARHFVLLSAFCVRNPLLELQRQKLRFEQVLTSQDDMTYSVVRPTAFFKSVSGQLEGILGGAPYVLFGDGAVTRCNPIAEEELAEFMMGSLDPSNGRIDRIMNVGGPDGPLTNRMLGELMYDAAGLVESKKKFVHAPTWIFDYVIDGFQRIADWKKKSVGDGNASPEDLEWWEDAAETARIGKYYAVEDMLTTDPDEKYGTITMKMHYEKIAGEGQDPFTPVRATAVIARVLENLPAASAISLPIGYALFNPGAVRNAVMPVLAYTASSSANHEGMWDFSVVLASLHGAV